ncbi:Hypothetical protein PBC10988_7250 [Planctomycetales bacterium 10988]|nr:Hypothetical protein PBC10988_7250 [Planctomycetales bacterium 10988]
MQGLVILGAGLSGLGCALNAPGAKIFEAQSHLGGHAYSHQQDGVYFDQGAHISHSKNPTFVEMIKKSAKDVVEIPKSHVQNYYQGKWFTYPVQNHLHEQPLEVKTAALQDLIDAHLEQAANPKTPENYLEWCIAQYGDFLTEKFYKVYTKKYWRCEMQDLSIDWLGGRLLPSQLHKIIAGSLGPQPESQAAFAAFRYPAQGGFFGFFESLYKGLDISTKMKAVEIDPIKQWVKFENGQKEHYQHLASSIPLNQLIRIIKDAPATIQQAAEKLRCTKLLCVNLVINQPKLTDNHWFYIYDPEVEFSRVSVPSNLSPVALAEGKTALQAEIFRRDDEDLNIDELVEHAVQQLSKMLNFRVIEDIQSINHIFVPRAYILSDHQRATAVSEITAWLKQFNIITMGLYGRWNYIWSDVAFHQGQEAANKITEQKYDSAGNIARSSRIQRAG